MALVETSTSGGVLTVTLNDLERRNALSRDLLVELVDVLDAADTDASVRVVVLTNNGNVFCAGTNLSEQSGSGSGALRPMWCSSRQTWRTKASSAAPMVCPT